jgi:SsrA-binding protein
MKIIALNKKALFDYEIQETLEAGIVLCGDEVKSIRQGKVSLIGAFATLHDGELYLINCNITPYTHAYTKSDELARRRRKLLLHKRQIMRLIGDMSCKGVVLIPLKLYFTQKSKVKVQIGLGKHKKMSQKKEILRERDIKRETARDLKRF